MSLGAHLFEGVGLSWALAGRGKVWGVIFCSASLAGFLGGEAGCQRAMIYCRLRGIPGLREPLPARPALIPYNSLITGGEVRDPPTPVKMQMLSGQKDPLNPCQLVTNYLKSFSPNSHLASLDDLERNGWKSYVTCLFPVS